MTQFGSEQGFYGQGNYSAHQASYRHHERYVYRLSDTEGHHHDAGGQYLHLMQVNVLHAFKWNRLSLCRRTGQAGPAV